VDIGLSRATGCVNARGAASKYGGQAYCRHGHRDQPEPYELPDERLLLAGELHGHFLLLFAPPQFSGV
jgi:hypothetical protein